MNNQTRASNRSNIRCGATLILGVTVLWVFPVVAAPGPGLQTLGDTKLFATGEGRQLPSRFDTIYTFQTCSVTTRTRPITPGQTVTCVYSTNNFATSTSQPFLFDYNDNDAGQTQFYTVLGPFPTGTSVQFRVEATGANGESLTDNNGGLNYEFSVVQPPAPTLTSVSPNYTSLRGNDVVNIFGNNFIYATQIYFGTQLATADRHVISATHIRLRCPEALAPGQLNVAAVTPGRATATLTNAYNYQILGNNRPVANELTSLAPVVATITGTSTTLPATGGNVSAAQTVDIQLDVTPRPTSQDQWTTVIWSTNDFVSWSWKELTFIQDIGNVRRYRTTLPLFPQGSTVKYVVIAQVVSGGLLFGGATANTPYSFTVGAAGAPSVATITPATVSFVGGQAILINGTNFVQGTTVTVNGQPAPVVANTGTQLRARTPEGSIGTAGNVVVTVPGHAPITRNNAFTYVLLPTNSGGDGLWWCGDTRMFISGTATELPPTGGTIGTDQTVSVITQAWPQRDGQTPWLVYSTNNFATATKDMMNFDFFTGNNTQYWEIINQQAPGTTVRFFITITGAGGEIQSDANNGAYFSYNVQGAVQDLDEDGVPDSVEARNPAPGQSSLVLPDSDLDGLRDGQEDANANGSKDANETSTRNADTDGDKWQDGVEVLLTSDPLNPAAPGAIGDADSDRLPDSLDPDDTKFDADGDKFDDLYEVVAVGAAAATNPGVRPTLADLNNDGQVSNIDALITQSFFLGNIGTDSPIFGAAKTFRRADVNGDAFVSNIDALLAQSFFLGNLQRMPFRPANF